MTKTPKAKEPKVKVLSLYELMQRFPDEQSAIDYLKGILWANGVVCPYCREENREGKNVREKKSLKNYYRCNDCKKDFTIRVGTIFHRSHIPLHKWIMAMYLIVTSRKGISSVQLSKELGIKQLSAWFLLQRIRYACGNMVDKILSGIVECDEAYIGGKEKNKHASKKLNAGRGTVGKIPVFGMRNRENGQVVAQVVKTTDKETLQGIIRENVLDGSTVCTDEHKSYDGLEPKAEPVPEPVPNPTPVFNFEGGIEPPPADEAPKGYTHKRVNHSAKQYVDGMAHTNGIESFWAVLKRGFYGTYHWFSETHLHRYVAEFVFRLNEGNCKNDTMDRICSLIRGVVGKRLTYKMLTKGI